MEPLQPNPNYNPNPKPQRKLKRKKRTTARPTTPAATSRQRPAVPNAARQKAAQAARDQPRDQEGRFAQQWGTWWNGLFDPTPRPPTRLKRQRPRMEARSFSEDRSLPAAAPRRRGKKRKKPIPQRSIFGKVAALFNGDYGKWKKQQNRKNARMALRAQDLKPPRSRRRRRKRKPTPPPRRGLFGFAPF